MADNDSTPKSLWPSARLALVPLLATALFQSSALAVINPRFTPLDLVKGAAQVQWLRLAQPQGNTVSAEVIDTLKGKAPAVKAMTFGLGEELEEDEVKAAFNGQKTTTAILFLSEKADGDAAEEPDGALEIETFWFAVFRQDGKLVLDKDKRQLFAVWGGSARMLAAATRYVQSDPTAEFPVRSALAWGESLKLGTLASPASGCLVADLGKPTGWCVLVLCEAGDRLYRPAPQEGKPSEITAQIKLGTTSKAAAVGDFNGDGRLDLVSWDGRSLKLAVQTADGTFAPPKECGPLAECLSLDCVEAEGPKPALVAGTGQGPLLLAWDGNGRFKARPLGKNTPAKSGPGGFCVVADFNHDGRTDVVALFSQGAWLYVGEGPGQFKAPIPMAMPLVDQPRAALCGDFDTDGWLDVLVAGQDGLALLSRESADRWSNATYLTGELAYHGNANQPRITACVPCDVNTDGRQGMALFYADRKPLLFFNRGFACFGWARELDFDPSAALPVTGPAEENSATSKPANVAPEDLKPGQMAGAIVDLNGDGLPDMLAVGAKAREVWAVFGRREQSVTGRTCRLTLPPSALGPVTVTVRDERRATGMYVVRPGIPALVARAEAGRMTLRWTGPDQKAITREVELIDDGTRFELGLK